MSYLKLCRLCTKLADRVGVKNIFDRINKKVLQHIKELTGIELEKCRDLPHLICKQCQSDLSQATDFLKRIVDAQAYFRNEQHSKNSSKDDDASNQNSSSEENVSEPPSPLAETLQTFQCDRLSDSDGKAEKSYMKFDDDDLTWEATSFEEFKPEIKNPLSVVEACLDEFPEAQEMKPRKKYKTRSKSEKQDSKTEIESPSQDEEECVRKMTGAETKKQRKKYKKRINTDGKGCKPESENLKAEVESCVEKMPGGAQEKRPRKEYKKRMKTENEPSQIIICELCGQHFKYSSLFNLHQKRHLGELQFECELCPSKFLTSYRLKCHIRTHTGEKPFPCQYCGRCFGDYSGRAKHERTHTNERPFACNQCGKTFARGYVLKKHQLVHTGERLYRCDLCKRSFQTKTHLKTHFRSTLHQELSAQDKQLKEAVEMNIVTF